MSSDSLGPDPAQPADDAPLDPDLARLAARTPSRWADRLGVLLDPVVVMLVVLATASGLSAATWLSAIGWWLVTAFFFAVLPFFLLLMTVRLGWVPDRHVVVRSQRHRIYLLAIAALLAGLVVLEFTGAPRLLRAVGQALVIALIAVTLINLYAKISGHAATMAGAAALLAIIVSPWTLLVTMPLLGALCWARYRAGRHSLGQIAAGVLVGAAVPVLWFAVTW